MKGMSFMNWADKGRRMAERARELFPPGTRIQLIHMDDPYHPIPDGTRGTVKFVDDMGTVFPDWITAEALVWYTVRTVFASLHQKNCWKNSSKRTWVRIWTWECKGGF